MACNGIAWVGNMYEKLESICFEVEEILYEDTVKYVESQVQTIGGSVKKFYSDILQDLLPPSLTEPVKATPDMPLKQTRKSMKLGVYKKPTNLGVEQFDEDTNVIMNLNKDMGFRSIDHLFPPSSKDSAERPRLDSYSKKNGSAFLRKRSTVKPHQAPTLDTLSPVAKGVSKEISSCESLKEDSKAVESRPVVSSPDTVEVTEEDDEGKTCREYVDVPIPNDGTVSLIRSPVNQDTSCSNSADTKVFVSRPDDSNMNAVQSNDASEVGTETDELLHAKKLEETCVMVDGNEPRLASLREIKSRSYKKKIQEAFSSKKKSGRKQEYEQLAALCGDLDKGSNNNNLISTLDLKKLTSQDVSESEWELL